VRGPVDRISGDQGLSARRTELAAVRRADRTFTDDSTLGYLQTDANFTAFVIGEANSGLLKYFLHCCPVDGGCDFKVTLQDKGF
jgi:hypothetical protein